MHVEVPERIPRVEILKRKPDIVELPTVVTSELVIEPYVEDKIVNSLLKETKIKKDAAIEIAREVRQFLLENKIREISAPMVREICVTLLLKSGLMEAAEQYCRVGLPITDVTQLIREHTRENANLVHNPETIHKLLADAVVREYTLTHVLPKHLAKAHLQGLIHVHKLDYFPIRPYCASADIRYFLKYGVISDGVGTHVAVTKPAKHAEVAILHIAKAYSALQIHHSGAVGTDFFNVFLAPYVRGLPYDRIKQLMQMFIFEMASMPASRGGQVVFSDVNFELGVPQALKDIPAVLPGGVIRDGVTYSDFEDEAQQIFRAAMEVYLEGDGAGKPFIFPKACIKLRREFIDKGEYNDLLFLAHKVSSKFGTPYFLNLLPEYMPDVVLAQCLPSYEKILVRINGELRLIEIGKLIDEEERNAEWKIRDGNIVWLIPKRKIEVQAFDKENLRSEFREVTALLIRPGDEGVMEITAEDGRTISVSPDHPMIVVSGNRLATKSASEVKKGEYILGIKKWEAESKMETVDLIEFLRDKVDDEKIRVCDNEIWNNLRQRELVKKLGVSKWRVSNWKRYGRMPLWAYLKISPNYNGVKIALKGSPLEIPAKIPISNYFMRLAGYYLAEGDSNRDLRFSIGVKENDIKDDITISLKTVFEINPYYTEQIDPDKNYNCANICSSKLLGFIFSEFFGKDCYTKRIPDFVYNLPGDKIKELLKTYFFGDGYFRRYKKQKGAEIQFTTTSKDLAYDIQYLLLKLGICTTIRTKGKAFRLNVQSGESRKRFLEIIDEKQESFKGSSPISERYDVELIYTNNLNVDKNYFTIKNAKSRRGRVGKEIIEKIPSEASSWLLKKLLSSNVHPLKIKAIRRRLYEGKYYDLEVKGYENFLHGFGLFTHNCCRVLVKMRKEDYDDLVEGRLRGGQFCNNTVNLPRIAYEAGDEGKIYELLRERMGLLKEVTFIHRGEIETRLKEGSLPFLSMTLDGQPYYRMDKVYHSIGMVGLNDMVQYITGYQLHESKDAWALGLMVIQEMNNIVKDFERETGIRWVLSQTPAETTATRFAVIDLRSEFADEAKKVVKGDMERGAVYYSNSTHVNWEANVPLIDKVQIEASFHPFLDGGLITAIYLGEHPDPSALMELTKRIAKNTLCAYWCYSLDFTQCRRCGYITIGIEDKCPNCGATEANLEWYAKVTNYYGRVKDWHLAKQVELRRRHRYKGAWGWS